MADKVESGGVFGHWVFGNLRIQGQEEDRHGGKGGQATFLEQRTGEMLGARTCRIQNFWARGCLFCEMRALTASPAVCCVGVSGGEGLRTHRVPQKFLKPIHALNSSWLRG